MLSLKKAADVENGWSLSEITTIHCADGMQSSQDGAGYRPRTSFESERIRKLFRTRTDAFETELAETGVSERSRVVRAV
jgi:hypothetical protein